MNTWCRRIAISLLLIWLTGLPLLGENQTGTRAASLFYGQVQAAWLPWLEEATELGFDELYSGASSYGLELSDKLRSLEGKKVRMSGFMAPPLKPTLNFFVLTRVPMSICPFCSTDADWPNDIVLVKLAKPVNALPFDRPITVTGYLELGSQVDPETGFVSLVRITAEQVE